MAHDGSMCRSSESPIERIKSGLADLPAWLAGIDDAGLGEPLVDGRGLINRLEAVLAEPMRRFEKSGAYRADGALDLVAWLRWKCGLSGGAAAERVGIARQMENLPRTQQAFARGDVGYQQVAAIARTADHIGVDAVRRGESSLLEAAARLDGGQFTSVAKNFEHQVDAAGALAEANRAHQRRYLHLGEPTDGLVRVDGLLDTEGGAIVKTALNAFMLPGKDDDRTPGQRRADAFVELCRRREVRGHPDGAGPRPVLVIRASLDTLVGSPGAPAAALEGGGLIPAETLRRHACDSAVSRIVGLGELEHEISHSSRSIPAPTRRALSARDHHCVFRSCDRQPIWCDGHHLQHWVDGGPTSLENLALLCRPHHRMVHEEGWALQRKRDGRFELSPPGRVPAAARSA